MEEVCFEAVKAAGTCGQLSFVLKGASQKGPHSCSYGSLSLFSLFWRIRPEVETEAPMRAYTRIHIYVWLLQKRDFESPS